MIFSNNYKCLRTNIILIFTGCIKRQKWLVPCIFQKKITTAEHLIILFSKKCKPSKLELLIYAQLLILNEVRQG